MNNPFIAALLVGLGGFVGSICRYSLSVLGQRLSVTLPTGTFAANVLGCFFIGIIVAFAARGTGISPELKLALATGFC
ncbi:MAG: fluoride efflux transporter FluC, partial [Candidatus Rifleibacteriota bacterium]